MPGLGTLVPEKTLMYVLFNKASSLQRSDTLSGLLLGLRVDNTTDTHTNMYLHHLLCAHSSYLYYIEMIKGIIL